MNKTEVKRIAYIAIAGIAGLGIGLGCGFLQVASHDRTSQAKIKEMNQRLTQTQKKYQQEMTLKDATEDEKQQAQAQLETLTKDKARLELGNKDLKAKVEALALQIDASDKKRLTLQTSLDAEKKQAAERMAKAEAERDASEKRQKQTFQTLQERERDLKQKSQKYDQCADNNARLYVISAELLNRYANKGVVTTLFEKEPFTKIKRVALEELVQDYKDRIDEQKLKSK
ncbi:MAG TPA: hypothetical protein VMT62_00745 [Syntrophorhabdaceae bacterium]|nr:hypothetical protein [Syntrophorhabdaceae bacterium]